MDSGDLAYLSKKTRKMLNAADLGYVKIVASNQLDEFIIKSLKEQGAPIDIFGVGTNLVTGKPDAALDGVALSSEEKVTEMLHPFEATKSLNLAYFDHEPLLEQVMGNGRKVTPSQSVSEIAEYSQSRLVKLPEDYKRFQNPHIYKIGVSKKLKQERDKLVQKYKF